MKCLWCEDNKNLFLYKKMNTTREFELYRCPRCDTVFVGNVPTNEELGNYYSNQYWSKVTESMLRSDPKYKKQGINLFNKMDAVIKKYNPSAQNICEIGCSFGLLLNELKNAGYNVWGQEYSQYASDLGNKVFGLNINCGSMEELDQSGFDVVIMNHVLEHSNDPRNDLLHVMEKLNKNGIVIIAVPNINSLHYRVLKGDWEWMYAPDHLFYFSQQSFEEFCNVNNLSLEMAETRDIDFDRIRSQFKGGSLLWENTLMREKEINYSEEQKQVLLDLGLGESNFVVIRNVENKNIDKMNIKLQAFVSLYKRNLTNNIILFGASKLGEEISSDLQERKIKIKYFVDNDKSKINNEINNIKIKGIDELNLEDRDTTILITSMYKDEIYNQLMKMNFTNIYCLHEQKING